MNWRIVILVTLAFNHFAQAGDWIPRSLNQVLGGVNSGMTVPCVCKVLNEKYPHAFEDGGAISGGTGLVIFKIDDRYSVSFSITSDTGVQRVCRAPAISVYDSITKQHTRLQVCDAAPASTYPFESVTNRGSLIFAKISKECGSLYLEEGSHTSEVKPGDILKLENGDCVTLFSHMASFKITANISNGAIGIDVENHYRTSPSDDSGVTERHFIRAEQ
jgi:hypothetical protein